MQDLQPVPYKVINKFHNEIRAYLKQRYGLPKIIPFMDIQTYRKKANVIFKDTLDFQSAGFISPDGKLKRLDLDLSEFIVKEVYQDLLNIDLDTLINSYVVEHDAVNYFGLEIGDLLLAGYLRIGWNKYNNHFYIQFDNTYCLPNNKVLKTIEEILIQMNTIYVEYTDNLAQNTKDYGIFSIKNGDSIKDIRKFINQVRLEN